MKKKIILFCLLWSSFAISAHSIHELNKDFVDSMKGSPKFRADRMDRVMHIAKDLYTQFIENPQYSEQLRIPKIIHHIWVGSPIPKIQKRMRQTWIDVHPDWEFMFWDDKAIAKFGLQNQKAYDAAINLAEKSDIARYEILYRIGGLYVDTDFEALKRFDLFHHCLDFYVGTHFVPEFYVINALIGSAPGHPILKKCIDNIVCRPANDYHLVSTLQRTGPGLLSKCMRSILKNDSKNIVAFPFEYFYPVPHWFNNKPMDQMKQIWVTPNTFAVHHWHVSWNKKR